MKRVKTQSTEWDKIFANHLSAKCLVLRIYKELFFFPKKQRQEVYEKMLNVTE